MAEESLLAERPREHGGLADYLREPFSRLRSEVDRMFDEFPARIPGGILGARYLASLPMPALEMKETDKEYRLSIEVPGVARDDVEISIDGNVLVIKGEKKEEREEKERDYTISERSYGLFERRVSLPQDAVTEKTEADSENGVIRITIPRDRHERLERRKIKIKAA